ncbi:DUF3667 domain-containing protein [Pontibacter sp. CAU 1760]
MRKNRRKFTQCPNCGYVFEDVNNYCPNCGQENHDLNVPVKHLLWEFLEGTLHYDTKFWTTLKYLLFRPGLLTEKFNLGQRASYVPPFRLYVFVSLVFFTALAIRSKESTVKVVGASNAEEVAQALPPAYAAQQTEIDSLLAANPPQAAAPDFMFNDELKEKFMAFAKDEENSKQKLLKNTSFMMFLLMPFFGFILYLFYYKQRRNYVEHLMFSVHFHTFFFILVILGLGIEYIFKGFDVDAWAFGLGVLYLYFALHQVYKQSYLRTFLWLIPITAVYLVSLTIFVLSTLAISIMLS